jgi:hypothetical protein
MGASSGAKKNIFKQKAREAAAAAAALNMLLIDQFVAESDMFVCVNFILLLFFMHIISHVESCTFVDHAGNSSVLYNVVILNLRNSMDECPE